MLFNQSAVDAILDSIFPLPEHFGLQMYPDEYGPNGLELIEQALFDVDPKAFVRYGITKLVIIAPSVGDVVIKIPFNGFFSNKNEEDDWSEIEWNPFHWANGSDYSDYCLSECEKYQELEENHLECFVAETMYYKTIDGVRIFLQEKVTPWEDLWDEPNPHPSKDSQTLAKKWYDENKFSIEPEWIANCLDQYGKTKVEDFLNYCSDIDLDILSDVHSGNYGYRKDGSPVVLDYSNYND